MESDIEKSVAGAKICRVCGDHALGHNFNAVTCESCKAFFRRNALKTKDFRCPFSNQCEITKVTRRFCQKCRMEKCLTVGMKKEWIMSEEEKMSKRQKPAEPRGKKKHLSEEPPTKRQKEDEFSEDESHIRSRSQSYTVSPRSQIGSPQSDYPVSPPGPSRLSDRNVELASMLAPSSSHRQTCEAEPHVIARKSCVSDVNAPHSTSSGILDSLVSSKEHTASLLTPHLVFRSGINRAVEEAISSSVREEKRTCVQDKGVNTDISIKVDEEKFLFSNASAVGVRSSAACCSHTSIDAILNIAIEAEFTDNRHASTMVPQRDLNDAERAKLNELIVANQEMQAPLTNEGFYSQDGSSHRLINVINLTEIAIRRIIKMAKRINSFRSMCQEDQIALLKDGCTEVMILKGVMQFDPYKNSWKKIYGRPHNAKFYYVAENLNLSRNTAFKMPVSILRKLPAQNQEASLINLDVLKEARNNIHEAFQLFIISFAAEWRSDENILLIMAAICLFNPERPHVIHKDAIKFEQASYYKLLLRYLESMVGGCEAKSVYLKLIRKISELRTLSENIVDVYIDANTSEIAPLLIEIFDLKYR